LYTLNTTALGVLKGLNKRWQNIDLTAISVQDLIAQYRIAQITLTPQNASEPVYVQLAWISGTYSSFTGIFQDLLDSLGNTSLPSVANPIIVASSAARFYDAYALGYRTVVVDADNEEALSTDDPEDFDDIRLDRDDVVVDWADAAANTLVNLNGFYHLTQNQGEKGFFVKDGLKSMRLANQNQVGFWDFRELGGFSILPTVPGQVDESGTAFQVEIPTDVSQKTVFFVIAGYFFPVDGTVISQNGAGSFLINFTHANMRSAARYFEAANYIDLSTVAAAAAGQTQGTIDTSLLDQTAAIQAWMALSQTFAVIVNRKNTYFQMRYVERTGNPNQYLCYLDRDPSNVPNEINNPRLSLQPPKLPLVLELGRHPPYWTKTEGWVHSFSIYNNRIGQLLYESGQPAEGVLTSGADQPGSPGLLQAAYLLEFGSDATVIPIIP
jgi:hypothetical protein